MNELLLPPMTGPLWNRSWLFYRSWRLAHPSVQDVARV